MAAVRTAGASIDPSAAAESKASGIKEDTPAQTAVRETHKVTVLFFASARDAAGVSETVVTLPRCATAKECLDQLAEAFPGLQRVLPTAHLAVNQEYAEPGTVIPRRAEVAVIPPVSGG